MSDFGKLLEGIHERRTRAGYREPNLSRERMPPDYIERCVRYPTVALGAFLAAVGVALAFVALLIWLIVMANGVPKPAASPGSTPARAAMESG